MKTKLFAILLGLATLSAMPNFSNAWTIRNTKNGGPNGYNATSKVVDNDGNTTISCAGAGNDACPASCAKPADQTGVSHALTAIAAGDLSDSWFNFSTGTTTTWTADSPLAWNSEIDVAGD